jgi:putative modified peptide
MANQPPAHSAQMTISDKDARDFLERLAADDDFRAELQQDPVAFLREHGIEVDPANVPATVTLPPKADVEAFLAPLRARAVGAHGYLGYAICYWVLGAMPLVVAEDDGTG